MVDSVVVGGDVVDSVVVNSGVVELVGPDSV